MAPNGNGELCNGLMKADTRERQLGVDKGRSPQSVICEMQSFRINTVSSRLKPVKLGVDRSSCKGETYTDAMRVRTRIYYAEACAA